VFGGVGQPVVQRVPGIGLAPPVEREFVSDQVVGDGQDLMDLVQDAAFGEDVREEVGGLIRVRFHQRVGHAPQSTGDVCCCRRVVPAGHWSSSH